MRPLLYQSLPVSESSLERENERVKYTVNTGNSISPAPASTTLITLPENVMGDMLEPQVVICIMLYHKACQ